MQPPVAALDSSSATVALAAAAFNLPQAVLAAPPRADSCTKVAGVTWAVPADVRACLQSFPLNETLRSNIVETVSKTMLTFHTSVNCQLQSRAPLHKHVRVDVPIGFKRLAPQQYPPYLAFHQE